MNSQRLIRLAAVAVATGAFVTVAAFSGLPGMIMGKSAASSRDKTVEQITLIAQAPVPPMAGSAAPGSAAPLADITPLAAETPAPDVNGLRAPTLLPASPEGLQPTAATEAEATDPTCRIDLAIIAQAGAMVDLGLIAPCRAGERVVIRHADLVLSGKTSPAGTLIASIPAFASPAAFTLGFPDGTEARDSVEIPDLAQYERFAVQWVAGDSFALNAFLEGADWDSAGHITAARSEAPSEQGGFLLQSGDPSTERPLLAQIYTWPAGRSAEDKGIELTLESEVTASTCGREVLAETLHMVKGTTTLHELTLDMPPCEAIGEFLVLSNPFALPTVAQN